MDKGAVFWAIDLHLHTPASADVNASLYGAATPIELVEAAMVAGLDAIAVTDHNTCSWCDEVATAALNKPLVVLPGVEISTTEGHLLAVWEEGTPSRTIDELLVRLGIGMNDQGKLDIAAEVGFATAAKEISAAGGLAVAAHIDKARGLLRLEVAAHVRRTLLEPCLSAVEVADLATVPVLNNKVNNARVLACLLASDAHLVAAIGNRRTWIKAARPDLIGLKHALSDPDLRIRLLEPQPHSHPTIESVTVSGGFLDQQRLDFSPDLNCLLGGTGTGKSLVVECIRYALDQQVSREDFPAIWTEVCSRLSFALGNSGVVTLNIAANGQRFKIERAYSSDGDGATSVLQEVAGDWQEIESTAEEVIKISAFSQGETLEYSRAAVGRMSLVDSGVEFGDLVNRESQTLERLRENARQLLGQRDLIAVLRLSSSKEEDLETRVSELSALFETDIVLEQEGWKVEGMRIKNMISSLSNAQTPELELAESSGRAAISNNSDLFSKISRTWMALKAAVDGHLQGVKVAIDAASEELGSLHIEWQSRFDQFKAKLDEELNRVGSGASLVALRAQLEKLQEQLVDVKAKKAELENIAVPNLEALSTVREALLDELQGHRDQRRQLRRTRADQLNSKTAGIVKLDVPASPEAVTFRAALNGLKTGSRVREEVLDKVASQIHPFRFARSMLKGEISDLVDDSAGIDAGSAARLLANLEDRNLWPELLETQVCDMPDRLNVKFRTDDGGYVHIEQLAHGQRCTAILVVLLADGNAPVVVDQPEDALHAPWIEDYLVETLRDLRGQRQYIFATRSPGIVVGADAEQIITMRATSGRGQIEAAGSLERHDLNKLTLHHLEGGAIPFRRRSDKLQVSFGPG